MATRLGAGGLVLVVVAVLLRRLLRLSGPPSAYRGLPPLGALRESIYQPVAAELETQSAMLGVSLNDAIEERDCDHDEIAWRLASLTLDGWSRLADLLAAVLDVINKHLPMASVPLPVRSMVAHRFRSRIMLDYLRMHEVLDQLVFRSRLRFHLHIRVLRRAVETLSADFESAQRRGELALDHSPEFWGQLDFDFHDFDLITKETTLAFRAFLLYLPDEFLLAFAADLQPIMERGVRSVPSERR